MEELIISRKFNPHQVALDIIAAHTAGYMATITSNHKSEEHIYEETVWECSQILVDKLVRREITPTQYIQVRNELGNILNGIFDKACVGIFSLDALGLF